MKSVAQLSFLPALLGKRKKSKEKNNIANFIFHEIIYVFYCNLLALKSCKYGQKSQKEVERRSSENTRVQIEPPPEDKGLSLKCKHYITCVEKRVRK